jgi:di/tripeptidase
MENKQAVCIQGHLDMVPVVSTGVTFDFDKDPLNLFIDGD